ncbi:MAG: hypothetical protein RBT71_13140, partial [Flavobacteriales bacterium]|nr:hypothetical protein [Flavobacteriales bacterium]
FGERESWGQKVMWYDGGFHDRGFMHLALEEWTAPPDSVRRKRTNVAPHMRMHARGDTTEFTFACDSLYMYDDARGGYDLVVPAGDVRYTLHPDKGLVLWLRGEPRPVPDPA